MKEEDFKHILRESILEKAPEGLSDQIMDRIAEESVSSVKVIAYSMPGKKLLIFLTLLFSGSIIWAMLSSPSNKSIINTAMDSISFDLPTLTFSEQIFNNLNAYLMMAFLAFLVIEFLALRKKKHSVI